MEKYTRIGQELRRFREQKRMTLDRFASYLSERGDPFDKSTLCRFEKNEIAPTINLLLAIDWCGFCTIDYLLFGKELLPVWRLWEQVKKFSLDDIYQLLESDQFRDTLKCDTSYADVADVEDDSTNCRDDWKPYGLRFTEAIEESGLSISQLCAASTLNRNTVGKYRNPERSTTGDKIFPSVDFLVCFCEMTDFSAAYLLDAFEALPRNLLIIQTAIGKFSLKKQREIVEDISKLVSEISRP